MELSGMSLVELRDLQERIKQELKKREHHDIAQARERIMAIAQSIGMPLKELMSSGTRTKTAAAAVVVRFRHPDDAAQQWTGRGRQPKWVKEWIASGKSLDLLRV